MRAADSMATGGALVLGAALVAVVVPRADPTRAGALVGLALVVVALVGVVAGSDYTRRRAAGGLLVAGGCVIAVAVGQTVTATTLERDLRTAVLPLVLALVAAALVRPTAPAALALVGGVLAGPVRGLVYDPFLDPRCADCAPGALVVWSAPRLAAALHPIGLVTTVAALLLALVWRRAAVEGWLVLACLAAYAADLERTAAVLVGAAAGGVWLVRNLAASWRRRREVRLLLRALDDGDDLTTALRRRLADPGLVVAYPDGAEMIDRSGAPVAPAPGQATTEVWLDGRAAARIHHDAAAEVSFLSGDFEAPLRLTLGNEQLTAQLAARVGELDRARAAVVAGGVGERRSLERDLHDGVQQDLLALGIDLRRAAAALDPADPERGVLDQAVREVQAALDEVRDISHGVYPALLATRGLAAAVASLTRRSGLAVELSMPEQRFADPVERAAYAVVAEAIDRGAATVAVRVGRHRLLVEATGAGPGVDGILPDLLAAVGGELTLGPTVTAVIPCG